MIFWVKNIKKNEKPCLFRSYFSFFTPIHQKSSPRGEGGIIKNKHPRTLGFPSMIGK